MVRSIVNVTNFLKAEKGEERADARQRQSDQLQDPGLRVMLALKEAGIVPVGDIAKFVDLPPQELLETIERLRAVERVELVEADGRRCLRLTPRGYAFLLDRIGPA